MQEGALGGEQVWGWAGCIECPVGLDAAQQDPGLDSLSEAPGHRLSPTQGLLWQLWGLGGG